MPDEEKVNGQIREEFCKTALAEEWKTSTEAIKINGPQPPRKVKQQSLWRCQMLRGSYCSADTNKLSAWAAQLLCIKMQLLKELSQGCREWSWCCNKLSMLFALSGKIH